MVRLRTVILAALALAAFAPSLAQGPPPPQLWKRQGGVLSPRRAGDSLAVGHAALPVPVVISTSSPVTVGRTAFYVCDVAGGCTYNLPAITAANAGMQVCVWNKAGRSGAITFQLPAATQMDVDGVLGTAAATLVSGGALGDAACVVAQEVGVYKGFANAGDWTNN